MKALKGAWRPGRRTVAALLVLVVLGAAGYLWTARSHTTIHARFVSAEGLHVNDDVKVLGVRVGKVTAIENRGSSVLVTMEVDTDQPIPAGAHAAIVSPSLVSGRYVQLAPVWSGGDRLEDGATIDLDATAVPVSFDDVKQQLTDLATTLAPPDGVDPKGSGALAAAVAALDTSLKDGNSGRLRAAIAELRGAADALSDGRSDLFSTVENLDKFTRNLALSDAAVRGFTRELDSVSGTLADNRAALVGALTDLADVLGATRGYLHRHSGNLAATLKDVNLLAAALADRSNEFAGALHVAPHTLSNLNNSVQDEAITTRQTATNFEGIGQLLCGAILGAGGTSKQCEDALEPLLNLLGLRPGGAR